MNIFEDLFENIICMSAMASIVILVVLILRVLLKKAPRKLIYGLWIIVAIRLIVPVMLPTSFSLFNVFDNFADWNRQNESQNINEATTNTSTALDSVTSNPNHTNVSTDILQTDVDLPTNVPVTETSTVSKANTTFTVSILDYTLELPVWSIVLWLAGIGLFFIYFVVSYIYLARKLRYATLVLDTDNNTKAYYCENISAPFVFGIIKPRIYIPYGIKGINLELILQHENYHIGKCDHLTKIFAFLLLSVYWFCPFVWIAYYFFQKDMELRCDEAILKDASVETRKCYSSALLAFAGNNRKYLLSPIAFSENNTKERIKLSLNARKISVFATAFAIVVVIIVAAVCLTDNKTDTDDKANASNDINKISDIPYGLYIANDNLYINIESNGISKGFISASYADVYEDYTIENNVIYAYNDHESIEIEIIDKSTLMLDKKEYIFKENNYSENSGTQEFDEATTQSTEKHELVYGIYCSYEKTQDGTGKFVFSYMYVEEDTIEIAMPWSSSSPSYYTYTVKGDIIHASNNESEIEIEIINGQYLRYDNRLYTYSLDIKTDAFLAVITYDDFESAIEVAKEYYSNTTIEVGDFLYVADEETFHLIVSDTWLEEYNPGQIICLKTKAIWGGSTTSSDRYITLVREDGYSPWTVLNEGK